MYRMSGMVEVGGANACFSVGPRRLLVDHALGRLSLSTNSCFVGKEGRSHSSETIKSSAEEPSYEPEFKCEIRDEHPLVACARGR